MPSLSMTIQTKLRKANKRQSPSSLTCQRFTYCHTTVESLSCTVSFFTILTMRATFAAFGTVSACALAMASPLPAHRRSNLESTPLNSTQLNYTLGSPKPCAAVSALVVSQSAKDAEVPAQLAYDCLQSVPLGKGDATRMINSFQHFFEFQSTTIYNKNPPSTYLMPAVDAFATFDQIRDNITSDAYHGEYDFQMALYKLVIAIHDDHLEYVPDLVADSFSFTRPVSLASISTDGVSLPKLYVVGKS